GSLATRSRTGQRSAPQFRNRRGPDRDHRDLHRSPLREARAKGRRDVQGFRLGRGTVLGRNMSAIQVFDGEAGSTGASVPTTTVRVETISARRAPASLVTA